MSEADGAGRPPSGARAHGCLEVGVAVAIISQDPKQAPGSAGPENAVVKGEGVAPAGASSCSVTWEWPQSWPGRLEPREASALEAAVSREELGLRRILALIPRSRASSHEFKRQLSKFPGSCAAQTPSTGEGSLGSSLQAGRCSGKGVHSRIGGGEMATGTRSVNKRLRAVTPVERSPPPGLPGPSGPRSLAVREQWVSPCLSSALTRAQCCAGQGVARRPQALGSADPAQQQPCAVNAPSSSSWAWAPGSGSGLGTPSPSLALGRRPSPWISLQFLNKAGLRPAVALGGHTGVPLTRA